MKQMLLALRELKQVLAQVAFSQAVLEGLIILLSSFIICVLINLPIYFGFIPGSLYFVHLANKKFKGIKLSKVEEEFPDLKEQLTTAADNLYRKNDIVAGLHEDVLRLMKSIKTSHFIKFKTMWRQLVAIAALCFALILFTSLNMQFVDYKEIAKEIQEFGQDRARPDIFEFQQAGVGNESDIFGNESLAELGLEELQVQINPIFSEINLQDIKEAKEQEFEEGAFPADIEAKITAQEGGENIPKEHKEIVKKYFSGLAAEQ